MQGESNNMRHFKLIELLFFTIISSPCPSLPLRRCRSVEERELGTETEWRGLGFAEGGAGEEI